MIETKSESTRMCCSFFFSGWRSHINDNWHSRTKVWVLWKADLFDMVIGMDIVESIFI